MSGMFTSKSDYVNMSLEERAGWFSKLLLLYLNPLFRKGANADSSNQIELADLGCTSQQDRCQNLHVQFMKQWEYERRLPKQSRSLWYVLWRTVGYNKLFKAIGFYTIYSMSSIGPVLILNALVKHFQGTGRLSQTTLWILVALMFVIPMTGTLFAAHSNITLAHAGIQFRNALIDVIYRKSLKLSPAARQVSSTGQIVNMFSSDTAQLQRFLTFLNNMVLAAPMIAVCLALIYMQVGVATFVGLGLIIVTFPLNAIVFSWLGAVRRLKVFTTDRRVKLMNEILNGIRIIKYYAWEAPFIERISKVREEELILLRKIAMIVAIFFTFLLMAVPTFLPVLVFYTYVKLGNQLDAAKAFTAIALFNLMQFPFVFLPMGKF
jgi:ATP-binding cassette, subfamily C (CFTR/MRP), member 1